MKKLIILALLLVSLAAQAYEPLIREDRIWEYCVEGADGEGLFPSHYSYTLNFKFDGTVNINGNIYHKLNCWYGFDENPSPQTVAYMRESYGDVYLLLQQDRISCDCIDLTLPVSQNSEVLLYSDNDDPALRNIVAYTYEDIHTIDVHAGLSITAAQPVNKTLRVNDKDWNVHIFYKEVTDPDEELDIDSSEAEEQVIYVEGVGNAGLGYLHLPASIRIEMTTNGHYSKSYFLRQKDLYGNTVFDAKWLKDQSGVTEIVPQERPKDAKSYDLTGKHVTDPEPGTIYIRDGEKHIAR